MDRTPSADPNRPNSGEEPRFDEESRTPLTDRDRDRFLDMLDNPPEPNDALRNAARCLRGTSDRTG